MQLGRVGPRCMGANIVRRPINDGRRYVVSDQLSTALKDLAKAMALGASLADWVKIWVNRARPG